MKYFLSDGKQGSTKLALQNHTWSDLQIDPLFTFVPCIGCKFFYFCRALTLKYGTAFHTLGLSLDWLTSFASAVNLSQDSTESFLLDKTGEK